ncbi:MAG TPA: universal stress protein [Syntrophorhabdaceae bacterium]|jgi:nucleotide-binding universal stress UspA family protein
MFTKILYPVDFSPYAEEILEYAVAIAGRFNSELHMIHVIPNLNYFTPYESFLTPENMVSIERNIESEVERDFGTLTEKLTIPVKKVTRTGVTFVEIIEYVKEAGIDLVVMGTHGRSGIEHILIGSVAEKVVRKAPCPVLTVRPRDRKFAML